MTHGIRLTREVTPLEVKEKGKLHVGDTLKVRLTLLVDAPRSWIVLSDPTPSTATVLGAGLGRDSAILTWQLESHATNTEPAIGAFRAYYQWVPAGKPLVEEYALRLNSPGSFDLPPTHAEAMYSPEVKAGLKGEAIEVLP